MGALQLLVILLGGVYSLLGEFLVFCFFYLFKLGDSFHEEPYISFSCNHIVAYKYCNDHLYPLTIFFFFFKFRLLQIYLNEEEMLF